MEIALYPVYNVLAKMVYPNEKLRPDILCMSGSSQMPITQYRGIDQHGDSYGYGMIDVLAGGIGAFAVGDGISTGGQSRTPISRIPADNDRWRWRKNPTDSARNISVQTLRPANRTGVVKRLV